MRTEQDILKDFEKLGYECVCNSDRELILEEIEHLDKNKKEIYVRIHIYKDFKTYDKERIITTYSRQTILPSVITMQEHKLLHELFTLWGWLENDLD